MSNYHYTFTFATEEKAVAASKELNDIGYRRNGTTVAFRDGKTVTLRPEFVSIYLCQVFRDLTDSLQ